MLVSKVGAPVSPTRLTTIDLSGIGRPVSLQASGSLLFVAADAGGLVIYNIADPSSPNLRGQLKPASKIADVFVEGNLAFLAALADGLAVVDVSDPSHPALLGQVRVDWGSPAYASALAVAARNGIVYIGTTEGIVFGFDYRTPARPRLVSLSQYGDYIYIQTPPFVQGFAFSQNQAFVAGNIVADQMDISQPRNTIGLYLTPPELRSPPTPASSAQLSARSGSPRLRIVPRYLYFIDR
jgi:hypothetical protein